MPSLTGMDVVCEQRHDLQSLSARQVSTLLHSMCLYLSGVAHSILLGIPDLQSAGEDIQKPQPRAQDCWLPYLSLAVILEGSSDIAGSQQLFQYRLQACTQSQCGSQAEQQCGRACLQPVRRKTGGGCPLADQVLEE